jgi:hypothetical protein
LIPYFAFSHEALGDFIARRTPQHSTLGSVLAGMRLRLFIYAFASLLLLVCNAALRAIASFFSEIRKLQISCFSPVPALLRKPLRPSRGPRVAVPKHPALLRDGWSSKLLDGRSVRSSGNKSD